jgi:hypothetical protein
MGKTKGLQPVKVTAPYCLWCEGETRKRGYSHSLLSWDRVQQYGVLKISMNLLWIRRGTRDSSQII